MFSAKAAARAAVKEDIDATRSESPPRVPSSLPARRRVDREPRRDGLQAAFLKFHNHAVDFVRARGAADPAAAFAQARRLTTWHYQWIVTNEILPSFVGRALRFRLRPRFCRSGSVRSRRSARRGACPKALHRLIDFFYSLWAPADLLMDDAIGLSAVDLALLTSLVVPVEPVPERTTEREIRVVVKDQSKSPQTYLETRAYESDDEDSRYELRLRLTRTA